MMEFHQIDCDRRQRYAGAVGPHANYLPERRQCRFHRELSGRRSVPAAHRNVPFSSFLIANSMQTWSRSARRRHRPGCIPPPSRTRQPDGQCQRRRQISKCESARGNERLSRRAAVIRSQYQCHHCDASHASAHARHPQDLKVNHWRLPAVAAKAYAALSRFWATTGHQSRR